MAGKMKKIFGNVRQVVVVVVVLAVVAGGAYYLFKPSSNKTVTAKFASAVGIYPGTPVQILGVNVGKVTSVKPKGATVTVKLSYDDAYTLPKNVEGIEVANSLVSDRVIQLEPAYTGGPKMKDGGTIDEKHTTGPAELDDIYSSLNTLSTALGPKGANQGGQTKGALSTLLNVAAANLKGNGAALGNSITQLSKAAQTLAGSRGNLFQTVANLRKFTGALSDSDGQVKKFNEQLAEVTGELADERTDLGGALHDLGIALDNVNTFVKANSSKLHTSITGLEDITGVLVKERSSLQETLALAPVALANIVHAYQPNIGALATRSNLSSLTADLTNPADLCGVLKGGGLLTGSLLGNLTGQITSLCTKVLKGAPGTPLGGVDLTGLLGGLTGGLTGGGGGSGNGLTSGGLPSFPIGGSS
jgi:phospholipid/cholesterol/gamma-HCH transport system substrate-binding protein